MRRSPLERQLVGPAGEHYVLYQLHRRGMLAAPAPSGTPEVDLLVLSPDAESIAATVQVKTRTVGRDRGWHMSEKHERLVHESMFYAFVDLEDDPPTTYVLPSAVVADSLREAQAAWLAEPGKGGRPHRETSFRRFLSAYSPPPARFPVGWLDEWRERWDLLTGAGDANTLSGELQ